MIERTEERVPSRERDAMAQAMINYMNDVRERGAHLVDEIFIPEYLGFKEHVQMNQDNTVPEMRVYLLDTFVLARGSGSQWILKNSSTGTNNIFELKNMLHAIICLECSGVPVSVETLTKKRDDIDAINDIMEEEVELEPMGDESGSTADTGESSDDVSGS